MSEQENERTALILRSASSPAQLHSAGRHLSIAAKLNQDLERGRVVEFLKRTSSNVAVTFLSRSQVLDRDLIESFSDYWDWKCLSENTSLPWSNELIERFVNHWDWWSLSANEVLPWSPILIERYEDYWKWYCLSRSAVLPWSLDLVVRFEHRWIWEGPFGSTGLSPESASSMTRPTPYLSNGDFFAASTSGCADTAAPAWL
jgi:hypothetical protein